jgi:DNA primase
LAATELKELVRSRTDIVQLIGESLTLQPERGGRLFKGLCPFHDDHNPSLQVNPERQTYKCWSCNEGGDCFSFVMKYEGVGFREALESLARRAGVELPQYSGPREESGPSKSSLLEVLAWAEAEFQRFFQQAAAAQRARDYLRERRFTAETLAGCRVGYHPDQWDWLIERAKGKYSAEQLSAVRLVKAREHGAGYQDYFVDRVLFPIHDERGRCVAFGGRLLPDSKQQNAGKYFNSSESPVFHKSRLIYGLDRAREAIRKTGTAVVMEGYVDCIKAHQAGVVNAVATLGTALTETHVTALKRLAQRVVLVYDGDVAGQNAAVRAIEKFLAQDVDIRILSLPDELDPDEFLDAHGVDAFESLVRQAPEAWEFQYRHCVRTSGVDSSASRLRVLDEMLALLTVSPGTAGSVKESLLVSQLADRLGIAETDARRRLRELRGVRSRTSGSATAADRKLSANDLSETGLDAELRAAVDSLQQRANRDDLLECELLEALFTDPRTIQLVRQDVGVEDIRNCAVRELLTVCFDLWDHGEFPELGRVLTEVESPHLKRLAVWLDEEATARGMAEKLAGAAESLVQDAPSRGSSGSTKSGLLQQVLDGMKWRRQQVSHETAQGRLAERLDAMSSLDAETRELLQQSANYHQQRAAQKLSS